MLSLHCPNSPSIKVLNDVPIVYIVDDDPSVREAICTVIESVGYEQIACDSAASFLNRYRPDRISCLLLDIRMPDINGLDLQESLADSNIKIPTIIISGHGDIQNAVRAMKAGALDFIEKPFRRKILLKHIRKGIELDTARRVKEAEMLELTHRLDLLTTREREILDILVKGYTNKEVAAMLGISHRTVEGHRIKFMLKLQIDSIVELVREMTTYDADENNI